MSERGEGQFEAVVRSFDAKYAFLQSLSEGAYGIVWKAIDRSSGRHVAIKKLRLDLEEESVPSSAIREVALLKQLDHQNIVSLLDVVCTPGRTHLVFEFFECDLKRYMRSRSGRLESSTIKSFLYQLCRGVEFCHASRILHRDLNPRNLLIDGRGVLKIAGFGLARAFSLPSQKLTHEVVTLWYRPLEILLGSHFYSTPVDMWGVGCILAEMATGHPIFGGEWSEIGTIFEIIRKLGTPTSETWPGVTHMPNFKPSWPQWQAKGWENIRNTQAQLGPLGIALLERLMVYDPQQRASARQALHHEYLHDVELPAEAAPLDTDEGATELLVPSAAIVAGPHSQCPNCPSMVWQLPEPQGGLCTACGAEVWLVEG